MITLLRNSIYFDDNKEEIMNGASNECLVACSLVGLGEWVSEWVSEYYTIQSLSEDLPGCAIGNDRQRERFQDIIIHHYV